MKNDRNTVEFCVRGKRAMFTDPIVGGGAEHYSYQVPTYEAIKGILKSIYWKPTFVWVVDKIRVMNSTQKTECINTKLLQDRGNYDLCRFTYLRDVCYQISAHFEWNMNYPSLADDRNVNKHKSIADRMIERGGKYDVFLGTRECQADVTPCVFGSGEGFYDNSGDISFGFMSHSFIYPDEATKEEFKNSFTKTFDNIIMHNGVIEFTRPEECEYTRKLKDMRGSGNYEYI